jgi:hypothetical protein
MAYYVFNNIENLDGTLYKIAENLDDLNVILNSNTKNIYKIINDSSVDFDLVRKEVKIPVKFVGNQVTFLDKDQDFYHENVKFIQDLINQTKKSIKDWLDTHKEHVSHSKWNNFYNQLSNLNLNNISYPVKLTLGELFSTINSNSTFLNIFELPE